MKKNKFKIGIFKDKKDIEFIITDDNIINITGMMGAGKTTLAKSISAKLNQELILLDWMFGASVGNRPPKVDKLLEHLVNIYPEMDGQKIFRRSKKYKLNKIVEKKHYQYADIIYKYLLENINLPIIIEGRHIYEYIDYKILKGKLIIKRTSLINSYKRAFKRDVSRLFRRYKDGKVKRKDVLNKIQERLIFPIKDYIKINKYIIKLLNEKGIKLYD